MDTHELLVEVVGEHLDHGVADLWLALGHEEERIRLIALDLASRRPDRVLEVREHLAHAEPTEIDQRCWTAVADVMLLFSLRAERRARDNAA